MKARVIATGEIINSYADVDTTKDEDYWTRLEHTYAGMAMKGMLSNPEIELDYEGNEGCVQAVAATAARFAHALVEKMKEEKK